MNDTAPLHVRLAVAGPPLSARVIEEMYASPFWRERFGDRGRRHAGQDGDYHIQYLCEALAAGDGGVFVRYARWLREVLVTRGMCSRHLADNFERLAAAIDREPWPDRARAVDLLRAAAASLTYEDGEAGVLDRARPAIGARAAALVPPDVADDLDHLLSYLADATALGRPELFEQHVGFLVGACMRRGVAVARLLATLGALATALAEAGLGGGAAAACLAGARARVEGR